MKIRQTIAVVSIGLLSSVPAFAGPYWEDVQVIRAQPSTPHAGMQAAAGKTASGFFYERIAMEQHSFAAAPRGVAGPSGDRDRSQEGPAAPGRAADDPSYDNVYDQVRIRYGH